MEQKKENLTKIKCTSSTCSQIHEKFSSTLNDNGLMLGADPPPPNPRDILSMEINVMKQILELKTGGFLWTKQ